jgi:uncharacterized membrane protein
MWNRATLKNRAKAALRGRYGTGVLIIFLYGLIVHLFSVVISQISIFVAAPTLYGRLGSLLKVNPGSLNENELRALIDDILMAFGELGPGLLIFGGAIGLVVFLFRILFQSVLLAGRTRWFVRNAESEYEIPVSTLFGLFRGSQFSGTWRSMFWRDIWQFIWGLPALASTVWLAGIHVVYARMLYEAPRIELPNLLDLRFEFYFRDWVISLQYLHIVGIAFVVTTLFGIISLVKLYSYRMVPYLLADNPRLGAMRTLRLSKRLTRGHKGAIFVLDLSFIGWYLLTMICCLGLPLVFWLAVGPYYYATNAELYGALRLNAVERKIVTMEELGYVRMDD